VSTGCAGPTMGGGGIPLISIATTTSRPATTTTRRTNWRRRFALGRCRPEPRRPVVRRGAVTGRSPPGPTGCLPNTSQVTSLGFSEQGWSRPHARGTPIGSRGNVAPRSRLRGTPHAETRPAAGATEPQPVRGAVIGSEDTERDQSCRDRNAAPAGPPRRGASVSLLRPPFPRRRQSANRFRLVPFGGIPESPRCVNSAMVAL